MLRIQRIWSSLREGAGTTVGGDWSGGEDGSGDRIRVRRKRGLKGRLGLAGKGRAERSARRGGMGVGGRKRPSRCSHQPAQALEPPGGHQTSAPPAATATAPAPPDAHLSRASPPSIVLIVAHARPRAARGFAVLVGRGERASMEACSCHAASGRARGRARAIALALLQFSSVGAGLQRSRVLLSWPARLRGHDMH